MRFPVFPWRTIRALAESKAFVALNLLLVVVPLLVRAGLSPSPDTFALYLAAFLLIICTAVYVVTFPPLLKYDSIEKFHDSGRTPDHLRVAFEKYIGRIEEIDKDHVRTKLQNPHKASRVDHKTFSYVMDMLDISEQKNRIILSWFYFIAFTLIAIVYLYRFGTVIWALFR